MAKTYVLAGHDHNGAFTDGLAQLEGRSDVVIIRPIPGESIADTMRKQGIAAGDNLVVASHGTQGGIEWNQGEIARYDTAFGALPEGINTIAVTSCFGGSAQASLASVPKGTVLQSLVGTETVNVSSAITQFSREAKAGLSPTDMFLEALDNVDPNQVAAVATRENSASNNQPLVADPNKVLPHVIGIGGNPPISINLNDRIAQMGKEADNGTLDRIALDRAVQKVTERFDTTHDTKEMEMTGFSWSEFKVTHEYRSTEANRGEHAEAALKDEIIGVSMKLQMGLPLETIEEKRIGYAIGAAYMETSGELDKLMAQAKSVPAPAQEIAATEKAQPAAQAADRPDVVSVQNFLNEMGVKGANGKLLTPDGIVGPNTLHAFKQFCEQQGLNPANGVDDTFQNVMASYQSGALTKQEIADIKESKAILNELTEGMSAAQLSAVRAQFADVRAAMMGSGNDTQVKEEIGQLVALVQNNAPQQDSARGIG